jgi:hypothetical protein
VSGTDGFDFDGFVFDGLICVDAIDAESFRKLMAGGLSDMVFADPPYSVVGRHRYPRQEMIPVHVRLRGGATRSLTLAKPLPIAQIRKIKPEVVAEIDSLLDHCCDREIAEILNRQGRRTWQNEPFQLQKIAHIRRTFK